MSSETASLWTPNSRRSASLEVYLLGTVDFDSVQFIQQRLADDISQRDDTLGALLICEHPSIVTIGREGSFADLLFEEREFAARRMPVQRVKRGGGALVHCRGQVAAYLIMPIERLGFGLKDFRTRCDKTIALTAGDQKVPSQFTDDPAGVQCRCGQFAWIGTSIHDGVSQHGLYLNVTPDIKLMRLVRSVPEGRRIGSLSMQRLAPVAMPKVRESLIRNLSEQFGYDDFHIYTRHPLLQRTPRKVAEYV